MSMLTLAIPLTNPPTQPLLHSHAPPSPRFQTPDPRPPTPHFPPIHPHPTCPPWFMPRPMTYPQPNQVSCHKDTDPRLPEHGPGARGSPQSLPAGRAWPGSMPSPRPPHIQPAPPPTPPWSMSQGDPRLPVQGHGAGGPPQSLSAG